MGLVRVHVLESVDDVARVAADVVSAVTDEHVEPVVGWPTGRTAVPLYRELARRFDEGRLSLASVRGFNLDELVLDPSHPASFRSFMEQHAWQRVGLDRDRCDIPNGAARDLAAECARYESAISSAGDLDLAILGVGTDGHVAYNQPGAAQQRTHVVELPGHVADGLAIPADQRPLRAITMGIGTLWRARRLLLLANGPSKAKAIQTLIEGPEDLEWPCSLLREHPNFDVLVTRDTFDAIEPRPTIASSLEDLQEHG